MLDVLHSVTEAAARAGLRILFVGEEDAETPQARMIRYERLSPQLLSETMPDIIVTSLLCRGYDALELADYLQALGFGGRLIVLARSLPDPAVVQAELAALGLGYDCELLAEEAGEYRRVPGG